MISEQKKLGAIYCNNKAWEAFNEKLTSINPSKVFVIIDENTKQFCLPILNSKLNKNIRLKILEINAGEVHKNINTCVSLWNQLSDLGADRNSIILNLGGGVITDLGGFVASTFKRGLKFINIPTTLLAMVDASVGGKNGIDLGVIKNQIGVINLPEMVLVDTLFLNTLPKEQITSGYAEMLKHGLIHSEKYWNQVKVFEVANTDSTETLIWDSIQIKNEIVLKDPYEKNIRKTLNFGHTLGHAIESYCLDNKDKENLLHGEAIAIGMVLVAYISQKMISLSEKETSEISKTMTNFYTKVDFTPKDIDSIIELLKYDKKNSNGKVLFVLLSAIGSCKINQEVPNDLIFEAFEYYKNS
ncbi:MAG: 3-dehydroquinate synthase [Flavobacteriaceae bacterium]|jgi:3-dehydroquinate synthase|uniref:3-dehydroquinate synthase n=1 Tax=Candidatus Marifrigoribacter sp. Uisw_064 TaxID=3230970 RepID=UPI003AED4D30